MPPRLRDYRGRCLQECDYQVVTAISTNVTDATVIGFKNAIIQAVTAISTNATDATVIGFDGEILPPVVLVYFSGHGIQVGSEQYLLQFDPSLHQSATDRVVCLYE